VQRRLYGQNVDMPLAVDLRTIDDWFEVEEAHTIWTLTDHQGTVHSLYADNWVNGTDPQLDRVAYTPFGVPDDTASILASYLSTFYAGRDLDRFTGLYNNRARWYDSAAGRFLSEDPIYADINPYRYALNSPDNYTDPSGEWAILPVLGFVAFVGYLVMGPMAGSGLTPAPEDLTSGALDSALAARADAQVGEFAFAASFAVGGPVYGSLRTAGGGLFNATYSMTVAGLTYHGTHDVIVGVGTGDLPHYRDEYGNFRLDYMAGQYAFTATVGAALPVAGRVVGYVGRPVVGAIGNATRPVVGAVRNTTSRVLSRTGIVGRIGTKPVAPSASTARQTAGLGAPKVASNDILATPNRLQNKLAAWRRYDGDLSLAQWSKRYDQLQVNRLRGRWAESFGEAGQVYNTPYGRRIVDNAPAIEIKSGYASRTKFIRRQVVKDMWLRRNVPGYDPVWRFVDETPSVPLLRHLETMGIPYQLPGQF